MLVRNTNSKLCDHSILDDGSCCCNCKHMCKVVNPTTGMITGYVCHLPKFNHGKDYIMPLRVKHEMCELHEFVGTPDAEFAEIEL